MKILLMFIFSYLIGSIPSGIWIGKILYKKDIRKFGSKNCGSTNTFRVLGKKAGIAVLCIDILKGAVTTYLLPHHFVTGIDPLCFGICSILGHTFPIFASFRGGKAVATSAGTLLGSEPIFFLYCLIIFLCLLLITRMVSLSSMLTAILATISTVLLPYCSIHVLKNTNLFLTITSFGISIFIFYRHKDNLKRIRNKTENKISFGINMNKNKQD